MPTNLSQVTAIAAGSHFSLALREGATDASPTFTSAASAAFSVGTPGSFTITVSGNPAPTLTLSAGPLPSWLSFNASTGVLSGTPPPGASSPINLTFSASNGVSPAAIQSFSLQTGLAPVIGSGPFTGTGDAGETFIFSPSFSGSGPFVFQWQRQANGTTSFVNLTEGGSYSGVATAMLTVSGSTPAMHGDQFRVVITNPFGSTISGAGTLTIRGLGSAGQQFVAVGEGGVILTSPDGLTWTSRTSGTTKRLRAAASSANQLVVVGEAGTILTSNDAIAWTPRNASTTETLRGVAAGPSSFIAVGGASTSLIRSSRDGIGWQSISVPTLDTLRGATWGNGLFVVVGQNGTILISPNGISWNSRSAGTSERLDGVVWTGSQFVVIGETGRLLSSTDGVSWTSSSSNPPAWLESLTWSSSRYVVTGAGGRIASSSDGAFWTTVPSGTPNLIHGVAWSGGTFSRPGNPVTLLENLRQTPEFVSQPASLLAGPGGTASFTVIASGAGPLTYQWRLNGVPLVNGPKYSGATSASLMIANVNAADAGNYSVVVTSSAGATVSNDAVLGLRGLGTTGQQFVAVGENGVVLTSLDGLGWTSRTSGTLKRLRASVATASQFVVVGETGTILTSSNGVAWAVRNSGTTETLRGVTATPGSIVAVGGASAARILVSSDGVTWSAATVPPAGSLRGVATGGGTFVAVGQNGTLLTSTDGLTWISRNAGTTERLDGVIWTGSQFVVIGQSGLLLMSADGVSWSPTFALPPTWLEGMTWNMSRYVVVGAGGKITTSTDGAFWAAVPSGTSSTIHGISWSGASLQSSGNPVLLLNNLQQTPTIITQPAATLAGIGGTTSFAVTASGSGALTFQWRFNGVPLANGSRYSGVTSSTLVIANLSSADIGNYSVVVTGPTGATISNEAALALRGLGTTGQQFVAVGENGAVLTSPDGFAWTARTSSTTRRLRAVTATPTQFIVVGEAGKILTSANGVTWADRTSGTTETLRGVAAAPGIAVAVGGAANAVVVTSSDGVSWSAATVPTAGSLRGVAIGNGVFVAVGKNGTILTSRNASSWISRPSGSSERLDGVIWTGSQFVVISESGRILTSADGASWDIGLATTPPSWLEAVTWNQSRYVAVGGSGRIVTSTVGDVWTVAPSGTTATIHGIGWSGGAFEPTGNPLTLLGNLQGLPQITAQPAPVAIVSGGAAALSVTASGTGLSYQWLNNGVPIAGATNATLSIPGANGRDAGFYSVMVSGAAGSTLSASARVAVAPTYTFSTLAGLAGRSGDADGTGAAARFAIPQSVATDDAGTLFVADYLNSSVRKVTVSGGAVSTWVTGFIQPRAMTLDDSGNAYVLEGLGLTTRLQKILPIGPSVSTLAGGNGQFNSSSGLCVISSGTLFIADTDNHVIQVMLPSGAITGYAGTRGVSGSADGPATSARFFEPVAVVRTKSGIGYVVDRNNYTIRKIGLGSIVTTLAGRVGNSGSADGMGNTARFSSFVNGLAIDSNEDLFVADSGNHTIRWVTSDGGVVTIAGLAGSRGSADGNGTNARFDQPQGLAVGRSGELYIADSSNHTIRRGVPSFVPTSIVTPPADQSVFAGSPAGFTVVAGGTGPFTYQWLFRGVPIAGATAASYAITSAQDADAGGYSVVVTGQGGAAVSPAATLSIQPVPPIFTLHPISQTLTAGQSVTFNASSTGNPAPTYQWRLNTLPLNGAAGSTLTLTGVTSANAGSYDVVATNLAGNTVSSPAMLTVNTTSAPPARRHRPAQYPRNSCIADDD